MPNKRKSRTLLYTKQINGNERGRRKAKQKSSPHGLCFSFQIFLVRPEGVLLIDMHWKGLGSRLYFADAAKGSTKLWDLTGFLFAQREQLLERVEEDGLQELGLFFVLLRLVPGSSIKEVSLSLRQHNGEHEERGLSHYAFWKIKSSRILQKKTKSYGKNYWKQINYWARYTASRGSLPFPSCLLRPPKNKSIVVLEWLKIW